MGLLRPGETCWRVEPGGPVRFLVDGQVYFDAVSDAIRRARRSIHLLGWSFDPRAILAPDTDPGIGIGHLLVERAKADPALDIRLLVWRSALPISATQDFFPHRARAWFKGTQVRFELDDQVPLGACHHQKIVVVDDALAFVGGADFASDRWDTTAHLDEDPRRRHERRTDARAAARGDGDGRRADRRGVRRPLPRPLARRRRTSRRPPRRICRMTCGRPASRPISTGAHLAVARTVAGLARPVGRRARSRR